MTDRWFQDLAELRAGHADALESFTLRGMKDSVVEKYSDQAHFIYELLQNADDAGATRARFELFPDQLLFAHNGSRRFKVSDPKTEEQDQEKGKLGDINSITAVGASNKLDESLIGKFGVGFKAVFQYTETPHIYDPEIFFKIERFIVPRRLAQDHPRRLPEETLFLFPFDHPRRKPVETYNDIQQKLRSLKYPVLFLANLSEISFKAGRARGSYGKNSIKDVEYDRTKAEFIHLYYSFNEEVKDEHLWLFSRTTKDNLAYAVGFFQDEKGKLAPNRVPAFCFFPTKETTGLNFIIHAPFLLNESREGIRAGDRHNREMINLLAALAADSLSYLKAIGIEEGVRLLDDNIFEIIPHDLKSFSPPDDISHISFAPFYHSIKKVLMTKELLPAEGGGYVSAKNAYWPEHSPLVGIFSNEQIAQLCKNPNAKWVFSSFGHYEAGRAGGGVDKYLDSLQLNKLSDRSFLQKPTGKGEMTSALVTARFIEKQPLAWLHEFYQWISESRHRKNMCRTLPIFLNTKKRAVAPFDNSGHAILFLPTKTRLSYETIYPPLLKNEGTADFVRDLGLTTPALKDEIYNKILPKYTGERVHGLKTHFKKFFGYFLECSPSEEKSFSQELSKRNLLLYFTALGAGSGLGTPDTLYFPDQPLRAWFRAKLNTKFVNWDEYVKIVGRKNDRELRRFLIALGVQNKPGILTRELTEEQALETQRDWPRATRYQKWSEKYIDGCREIIEMVAAQKDSDLSLLVWNQLLQVLKPGLIHNRKQSPMYGTYSYFYGTDSVDYFPSSDAEFIKSAAWLLDKEGQFRAPQSLTVDGLWEQYDLDSQSVADLFTFLGIDDNLTQEQREKIERYDLLIEAGFTDVEIEGLIRKRMASGTAPLSEDSPSGEQEADETHETEQILEIAKAVAKKVISNPAPQTEQVQEDQPTDDAADEDDYLKPVVDHVREIEKLKEKMAQDMRAISERLELETAVSGQDEYSFGWFKALLALEALNSEQNKAYSREISISFSRVEKDMGTSRILILRHPNRHIPQRMEDLADIPLELHFADGTLKKVAVEVVSVQSYTLRTKLRTHAEIDGLDLSKVVEAKIVAQNPVFLIEALRKAFCNLEIAHDEHCLKQNLCHNIEFVFGPPGTGKTTHLVREVILPLMSKKEDLKVLVLTPTNKAADVLVKGVMREMKGGQNYLDWLVRFGATNDRGIESSGVYRDKSLDIREFPRNVTVTTMHRFAYDYFLPDSQTRLYLDALKWDVIIFDEASMIPLPYIVYPLYKKTPRKFIISGDPFQIEPIATEKAWKDENIYTMVGLNSFTKPQTAPHNYHVELLTTQYRSIPQIGRIFSKFAYGGVLKHHRNNTAPSLLGHSELRIEPLTLIKFPVSKYESIYRPKRLQNKSNYQIYSALFAFEFVKYLAAQIHSTELFRIGLIAPYRAQADLIDKLRASVVLPRDISFQVDTIHGFQGDECELIIALFNPPPHISDSEQMFLNRLNIINVSISRARDYLCLIMPDDETENIENLRLIKRVEDLCKGQPGWVEHQAQDLEKLMFGNPNYLEENSFATSHQLVNVYGRPEKRYEVRSETSAVDVQVFGGKGMW